MRCSPTKRLRLAKLLGSAGCLSLAAMGSGAAAQPAAALDEVVVTAQRTATNLQRTPIAITALSAEALQKADVRSVADLDKHVPGLVIQSAGAWPLNVTIRGIGYDGLQNNSSQPGVAFVENGVYIASPLNLTSSFLDLAQMEVLRGPQGTVNGQNADGGAMNATTRLATLGDTSFDGEASYGSYAYERVRGAANAPLSDTAAVRLAIQHEAHKGWIKSPNQPFSGRSGSQDALSARASLLWAPTERLSVTLWGEYFDLDANGLPVRNSRDPIGDVRATSNDTYLPQQTRSRIAASTITYDLDFATLKLVSSYQSAKASTPNSGDLMSRANALAIYGVKDEVPIYFREAKSHTEEINLAHTGGAVDWIVGAFYLHTDEHQRVYETQQSSPTPIPVTPIFNPSQAQIGMLYGQGLAFVSVADAERTSYAAYGQATWHVSEVVRLTGGLRYSSDDYASDTSNFFAPPAPLASKFETVTGKAVVEYEPVERTTVYASFSTGVKPGGTNLNPGALIVPTGFRHESVRAYELGLKSEFAERRVRLNVSGFYNDYRNYQTASEDPLPFHGGQTNIPKSYIYGLEAEGSALLPQGFRASATAAWMRSKVTSHFSLLDPQVGFLIDRANGGPFLGDGINQRFAAFRDVKGNELPRTPRFAASVAIDKSTQLGDAGTLDLYLGANYRSGFKARVFDNPLIDDVGDLFVANFNARFEPADGPWYLELQVVNITGSDDVASRFPDNFEVGAVYDYITPPRQVIGRFGVRF
ncbi:TonB-dependent receptor [Phenylobacterium sp. VNQ135]|uniref:TonB-dependent receptor n=1 Tax=Phenylobacterium sp. VNQ135 TaxID=3400922 RepID=UPI003C03FA40